MRLAFLFLATNVRSQEEAEEEGPQIDPRALFMTQLGSMQGSLAIPFIMSGGLNGQQSDYLQYLLLKTESTCDAATNALKYMMITTSSDTVPLMPMLMTKLGTSSYKTLSLFYLMCKMNRRVVDRYGRVSTAGLDMQTIMIFQDLRKECGTSSNEDPQPTATPTTVPYVCCGPTTTTNAYGYNNQTNNDTIPYDGFPLDLLG